MTEQHVDELWIDVDHAGFSNAVREFRLENDEGNVDNAVLGRDEEAVFIIELAM